MFIINKLKQISVAWYFLIVILLVYFFLFIFKQDLFFQSTAFFNSVIFKIIPIFVLVFVLMSITNYFVTPKFVSKHLNEKGVKKWIYIIIGGVLSTGPIYMWYPLLADLKNKGLSYGLIACFLYNRGIKITLLPIAIFYFGWKYVLVLSLAMIFVSIIQGILLNKLIKRKK